MQAVLSILAKIGLMLITESVAKQVLLIGLDTLAKHTETDVDDRLAKVVREAWYPEKKAE